MFYKTIACGVIALASLQVNVQAADIESGKQAYETCRGCHSIPSYTNAYPTYNVPKIGGQVPAYTASALRAYQKSARKHRTMKANTHDLSDQTIDDIAAFLAQEKSGSKFSQFNHGDVDHGKKLSETCVACHNDDRSAEAVNPRLKGQHASYIEVALKEYQSGMRDHALMKSMVEGLSKDDIKDIAAYFSSMKGLRSTN